MLREKNIDGDGQGDLRVHGGTYKAVYAYPFEHYGYWKQALRRDDLTPGQFGENLTIEGILEDEIYIGDIFQLGETAKLQVTQPRIPCYKLAYKMGVPAFAKQFLTSRRVGFYFQVLTEGNITAGDEIVTVERPSEKMSITEILNLRHFDMDNHTEIKRARKLSALSPSWKRTFNQILSKAGAF